MNRKLFCIPRANPNATIRLFCFPYAGGSSSIFTSWVNFVAPHIELVFVHLPGRGIRMMEEPHEFMEDVIAELLAEHSFISSKPFAFFGHSLGSRIAYELTQQLHYHRFPLPEMLFVSASRAPHISNHKKLLHNLPYDEFIAALKELNGTPREVLESEQLMNLLVPLLRADFKIAETYIAECRPLPINIHVFNGSEDDIPEENVAAWQHLSENPIARTDFASGHFFIHHYSSEMVNVINQSLESKKHALYDTSVM
ncbi:thioesterase II family protein [Pseudoalteromonas fenneropenaei]|uniref:Thioesterase II family protein n=1 Tax=Pseudoalteromonas fenneropenaei TaxID=1737459 RepID=A0ABV7CHR9_9GAMM